jgi:hypothetical protein
VIIRDANGTDSTHRTVKEGSLIEVVSTADTRQSSKAACEGEKGLSHYPRSARPSRLMEVGTIGLSLLVGMAAAEGILQVTSSEGGLGAARDLSLFARDAKRLIMP